MSRHGCRAGRRVTTILAAVFVVSCGGSEAQEAEPSDTGAGRPPTVAEFVDATALDWGLELAGGDRSCLVDTLVAELDTAPGAAIDEDWLDEAAPIRLPFYFVSCGVDVTTVPGDADAPSPLDVIVGALLADENVVPTFEEIECVERGLLGAFGSSGLIELLGGTAPPDAGDDAAARDVFDACGLDGERIVDG